MERLICLLIGYIFGMFQTSYIIGKMHHKDIRNYGSGNAGTTNALRTFGKKAGALTLIGDMLKCILAILLVNVLMQKNHGDIMTLLGVYAAAGCILGHNFPFYLKFRGGKGIAASAGMLLALDYRVFVICVVVFLVLFLTTHYVSLGSIVSYVTGCVCFMIFGALGVYGMDLAHTIELDVVFGFMTALALYRHRANISRLIKHEENKTYLGKAGKKK